MANTVRITRPGYQCQICKYTWIPRNKKQEPIRCANTKCRSKRWDGRPKQLRVMNPEIRKIMKERGITRQGAEYIYKKYLAVSA